MNDKGSVVGGYIGYVSSGYFSTKMNATKDGYEWFGSTATDANKIGDDCRPLPLKDGKVMSNPSLQTLTNTYRIYVRTGSELTYALASNNDKVKSFNGREVALEDYVTPFKQLFTQANGLARGAENLTGAAALKGMSDYYNASSNGYNEEAWKKVGVKSGTDSTGSYLDFEFVTPCTPFYAMYYLSSSLYAPIPEDFLTAIGGIKVWGSYNSDKTLTPVDTTLSTSVYVVEDWQEEKEFVLKNNKSLNPAVKGGANCYTLDGLHVNILKAAATDPEAAWNEFKAGKLDAVGIPQTKIKEGEAHTAGTQSTKGSSSTKLNINTCTPDEWEYLFGENGTITQTPKNAYWELEPALSNDDFLQGLSWAMNRKEFAENRGVTPSLSYFTDNYLANPEDGISYNDTEAHKKAMDAVYGSGWETNFGYDLDKAIEFFKKAATKFLADGTYKEGDTITLEVCWQADSQIKTSGEDIAKYLETAFNADEVCGGKLKLKINNVKDVTINNKVKKVIKELELNGKEKTYIKNLSGGEKKRAAIAMELLNKPEILLLDEPTSGLDSNIEKKLMRTLRSIADEGKTIIITAHTVSNLYLCDKIIFMSEGGKICFVGSYEESLKYFKVKEFVDIYEKLKDPDAAMYYQNKYKKIPLSDIILKKKRKRVEKDNRISMLKEIKLLSKRYAEIILNNHFFCFLLFFQAVIMGLAVDIVAKSDWLKVYDNAKILLFAFSCAAMWLGLFNSVQEIVKERDIIKLEYFNKMRLSSYIISKLIVFGIVAIIQTLLWLIIISLKVDFPSGGIIF